MLIKCSAPYNLILRDINKAVKSVEKKNQLDATEWLIALIICSTCFGHSSSFPHPGRTACWPAPDRRPPATKALHTTCDNNTSIVSSSWGWAYKCPKHVEQIISAISHSVASSWFFFSTLFTTLFISHSIGSIVSVWSFGLVLLIITTSVLKAAVYLSGSLLGQEWSYSLGAYGQHAICQTHCSGHGDIHPQFWRHYHSKHKLFTTESSFSES